MKTLCLAALAALFLTGCEGVNAAYRDTRTGKAVDYYAPLTKNDASNTHDAIQSDESKIATARGD